MIPHLKSVYLSPEVETDDILTTLPLNASYGDETAPGSDLTTSDDLDELF